MLPQQTDPLPSTTSTISASGFSTMGYEFSSSLSLQLVLPHAYYMIATWMGIRQAGDVILSLTGENIAVVLDNCSRPLNLERLFPRDAPLHIEVGSGKGAFRRATFSGSNGHVNITSTLWIGCADGR